MEWKVEGKCLFIYCYFKGKFVHLFGEFAHKVKGYKDIYIDVALDLMLKQHLGPDIQTVTFVYKGNSLKI